MSFIAGGVVARRVEPGRISKSQSQLPGIVNFATAIPLEGFAPGAYQLQVHVIDHASKKSLVNNAEFRVE